jgi:hypothetical protein
MRAFGWLVLLAPLSACGTDTFSSGDGSVDGSSEASLDASTDTGPTIDGTSGEGGAGGIKDVPGLILWLFGANGLQQTGGRVTAWMDQSGKNNNALPPASMVDGASVETRPDYIAQSINSRPGVRFRLDQYYELVIADSQSMRWGTSDFLLEIVARFSNDPIDMQGNALGCLFFKGVLTNNHGPGVLANYFQGGFKFGASATVDSMHTAIGVMPYNDGNGRIYAIRRIGGNLELRVNGGVVGMSANATTDVSESGLPAHLGSLEGGSVNRLDGEIDEVIGVVGSGAASHVGTIEVYLRAKYNL